MKAEAKLNNIRISPRKVRLVTSLITGMDTEAAISELRNTLKRSSSPLEKLIKSAVSNAENNFGLDRDNLYIQEIKVGEGATLKRWMPRAYGRATSIRKRTSKIHLILEERVEGKNRKTKEEMEKEKKKREEERKKLEEQIRKEAEQGKSDVAKEDDIVEKAPSKKEKPEIEAGQKKGGKRGFLKKMFNRKSV